MKFINYLLILMLFISCAKPKQKVENLSEVTFDYKPNILWISIEDISAIIQTNLGTKHKDMPGENIKFYTKVLAVND